MSLLDDILQHKTNGEIWDASGLDDTSLVFTDDYIETLVIEMKAGKHAGLRKRLEIAFRDCPTLAEQVETELNDTSKLNAEELRTAVRNWEDTF